MDMSEENIDNNRDKHLLPVTVIVKRIAKKNKFKEFEKWLSGISKEVSRQKGSMGIDIIRIGSIQWCGNLSVTIWLRRLRLDI